MLHLKCSNILLLFYRNNKCLHFKASNVSILKFSKKRYKNHLFLLLSRFLGEKQKQKPWTCSKYFNVQNELFFPLVSIENITDIKSILPLQGNDPANALLG